MKVQIEYPFAFYGYLHAGSLPDSHEWKHYKTKGSSACWDIKAYQLFQLQHVGIDTIRNVIDSLKTSAGEAFRAFEYRPQALRFHASSSHQQ